MLIKTTDDWRSAVDKRKVVGTVFIDISKAFDCISHSLLLQKMLKIGVTETVLTWFTNFLSIRQQRVIVSEAD